MNEFGQAKLVTATGQVTAAPCRLLGFYVNNTTSGTLVLHDHASAASNAITGTITPAIGFHRFPVAVGAGLHVVIANTLNVTFIYQPG